MPDSTTSTSNPTNPAATASSIPSLVSSATNVQNTGNFQKSSASAPLITDVILKVLDEINSANDSLVTSLKNPKTGEIKYDKASKDKPLSTAAIIFWYAAQDRWLNSAIRYFATPNMSDKSKTPPNTFVTLYNKYNTPQALPGGTAGQVDPVKRGAAVLLNERLSVGELSMLSWAAYSMRALLYNASNPNLYGKTATLQTEAAFAFVTNAFLTVTTYAWYFGNRYGMDPKIMGSLAPNKILTPTQLSRLNIKVLYSNLAFGVSAMNGVIATGFGAKKITEATNTKELVNAILQTTVGVFNIAQFTLKIIGTTGTLRKQKEKIADIVTSQIEKIIDDSIIDIFKSNLKQSMGARASDLFARNVDEINHFIDAGLDVIRKNGKLPGVWSTAYAEEFANSISELIYAPYGKFPEYKFENETKEAFKRKLLNAINAELDTVSNQATKKTSQLYQRINNVINDNLQLQNVAKKVTPENISGYADEMTDQLLTRVITRNQPVPADGALANSAALARPNSLADNFTEIANSFATRADADEEIKLILGSHLARQRMGVAKAAKVQIAGTVFGMLSMGASVGMLVNELVSNADLTSEQKKAVIGEIVLQVGAGVMALVSDIVLTLQVAKGVTTAIGIGLPAFGVIASAAVLAISPMAIQNINSLRNYSKDITDLNNDRYGGKGLGYTQLANYYTNKADLEAGSIAVSVAFNTAAGVVSVLAAVFTASTVLGPLAIVAVLVAVAATLIYMAIQFTEQQKRAQDIKNTIANEGGRIKFYSANLQTIYESYVYTDSNKATLRDLQNQYKADRVLTVMSVSADSALMDMMMLSGEYFYAGLNKNVADGFINGNPDPVLASQVVLNTIDGTLILPDGSEGNKTTQVLKFLSPILSPGATGRGNYIDKSAAAGKSNYAYEYDYLTLKDTWIIKDGNANSYIDISNMVASVKPPTVTGITPDKDGNTTPYLPRMFQNSEYNLRWTDPINIKVVVDGGDGDDTVIAGFNQIKFNGGSGNNSISYASHVDGGSSISVKLQDNPGDVSLVVRKYSNEYSYQEELTEKSGAAVDGGSTIHYRSAVLFKDDKKVTTFIDELTNVSNITGTFGNDLIIGNKLSNVFTGGLGADIIYGEGGDDYIIQPGSAQYDTLYGGNGFDIVSYNSTSKTLSGIVVDLSGNYVYNRIATLDIHNPVNRSINLYNNSRGSIVHDYISGFEGLIGSPLTDVIDGSNIKDVLKTGGGNDYISGRGGDDLIYVTGDWANVTADGGADADTLDYSEVNNNGVILKLSDALPNGTNGSGYAYPLVGSPFVPVFSNYSNYNVVNSPVHNYFQNFENVNGSQFSDIIYGNKFENVLYGGKSFDWLYGEGGDDYIFAEIDNDTINGGDGNDTLDYSRYSQSVYVDLPSHYAYQYQQNYTSYSPINNPVHDRIDNIEYIVGTSGTDVIIGDSGNNTIIGGRPPTSEPTKNFAGDYLFGGDGDDRFIRWAWLDNSKIDGGDGSSDIIDYSQNISKTVNQKGIYADLSAIANSEYGKIYRTTSDGKIDIDKLYDYVRNIEGVVGTNVKDVIIGDSKNNIFIGGQGVDKLVGNDGADTFYQDRIEGDTIYGNAAIDPTYALTPDRDIVDYSAYLGNSKNDLGIFAEIDRMVVYASTGQTKISDYRASNSIFDNIYNIEGIIGSEKQDIIFGDGRNNYFYGGAGVDTLNGGRGDDQFDQGRILEGDQIDGGDGSDSVIYALYNNSKNTGLYINLTDKFADLINVKPTESITSTYWQPSQASDRLLNIENVVGTDYADLIYGNASNNVISGGLGSDLLYGLAGDDYFNQSKDLIDSKNEVDKIDGGENSTNPSDNDTIDYSGSILSTKNGLMISLDQSIVYRFSGDKEYKNYINLPAVDIISNIESVIGTAGSDVIIGNGEDNVLSGGSGLDYLYGNLGSDTFQQSQDDELDYIDGGDGFDIANYQFFSDKIKISLQDSRVEFRGKQNSIKNIEMIIATAYADELYGDSQANYFSTSGGADIVKSYGGDDYILMGSGISGSTIDGGKNNESTDGTTGITTESKKDNDTVSYYNYQSNDKLGLEIILPASAVINGSASVLNSVGIKDILIDIESVIGSGYNDRIIGNQNNNVLNGNLGYDNIFGQAGDDFIISDGSDDIDGGDGADTVDFSGVPQEYKNTIIDLTRNYIKYTIGNVSQDKVFTVKNIENISGTTQADTILGDTNNNRIFAVAGDDQIWGNAGDDVLDGGAGSNTIKGGSGDDQILIADEGSYNNIDGEEGNDSLNFSNLFSSTLGQGLTIDLTPKIENSGKAKATAINSLTGKIYTIADFTSIEGVWGSSRADTIIGNDYGNYIDGGLGNDAITGKDGNDTLIGSYGSDLINGGNGDNEYLQSISDDGVDTIIGGSQNDSVYYTQDLSNSALPAIPRSALNISFNQKNIGIDGIYASLSDSIESNQNFVLKNPGLYQSFFDSSALNQSNGSTSNLPAKSIDNLSYIEHIYGSSLNDFIAGNKWNNNLTGNAGDDIINGKAGEDVIYGGAGDDIILGGDDNDVLSGDQGSDIINGDQGDDQIFEYIESSSTNRIDGGDGVDHLSYVQSVGPKTRFLYIVVDDPSKMILQQKDITVTSSDTSIDYSFTQKDKIAKIDLSTSIYIQNISLFGTAESTGFSIYYSDTDISFESLEKEISINTVKSVSNLWNYSPNGSYIPRPAALTGILVQSDDISTDSLAYKVTKIPYSNSTTASSYDYIKDVERISGTIYSDIFIGSDKDDVFVGAEGNDVLQGEAGNDQLFGGSGSDIVFGGAGFDSIYQGYESSSYNSDTLDGGDGELDELIYSSINASLSGNLLRVINKSPGASKDFSSIIYTLIGVDETGKSVNYTIKKSADQLDFSFDKNISLKDLRIQLPQTYSGNFDIQLIKQTYDGNNPVNTSMYSSSQQVIAGVAPYVYQFNKGIIADLGKNTVVKAGGFYGIDKVYNFEKLFGTRDNDLIYGSDSIDYLAGGSGDDIIEGRGGNDILQDDAGNDILRGGDGDDIFIQNIEKSAKDEIDGGAGYDLISFGQGDTSLFAGRDGVVINLNSQTIAAVNPADYALFEGMKFSGIEGIIATNLNDTIYGNTEANYLSGGSGNDTIEGGAGDDDLFGDIGDDVLKGGSGNDNLSAGVGSDRLYGGDGSDTFQISNYIFGSTTIWGGDENQTQSVNGDSDIVDYSGGALKSRFMRLQFPKGYKSAANPTITLLINGSLLTIPSSLIQIDRDGVGASISVDLLQAYLETNPGAGTDSSSELVIDSVNVDFPVVVPEVTVYFGNSDMQSLSSSRLDELKDTVKASTLNASTIRLQNNGVSVNLESKTVDKYYSGFKIQSDQIMNVNGVIGTLYSDNISGNSYDNNINASGGDDNVYGGAGDDYIKGGVGNDYIWAGSGNDIIYGSSSFVDKDFYDGGFGNDTVDYSKFNNTLSARYILLVPKGAVTSYVTNASLKLFNLVTDSSVVAQYNINRTINNYLQIDLGSTLSVDDLMIIFDASSTYDAYFAETDMSQMTVDQIQDIPNLSIYTAQESSIAKGFLAIANTGINVDLNSTAGSNVSKFSKQGGFSKYMSIPIERLGTSFGVDTLVSIDNVTGTLFNDTLNGNSDSNAFNGLAGNDVINGGAGNDILSGGIGSDTVIGGTGDDIIYGSVLRADNDYYDGGTGNDTIDYSQFSDIISARYILIAINNSGAALASLNSIRSFNLISNSINLTLSDLKTSTSISTNGNYLQIDLQEVRDISAFTAAFNTFSDVYFSETNLLEVPITKIQTVQDLSQARTIPAAFLGNYLSFQSQGLSINLNSTMVSKPITSIGFSKTMGKSITSDTILNFENIRGTTYGDQLTGTDGDNIIEGGAGNDTLAGRKGNDSLIDTDGADIYRFENGDGADVITDTSSAANKDVIMLGSGIAIENLWFSSSNGDLLIRNLSSQSDSITVKNWFQPQQGNLSKIEQIQGFKSSNPNSQFAISAAGVDSLVQTMAAFSLPAVGALQTPQYKSVVDAVNKQWTLLPA